MRSSPLVLSLLAGCIIPEHEYGDVGHNLNDTAQADTAEDTGETGTIDRDTAAINTPTPETEGAEIEDSANEPSGLIAEWVVASESMTIDTLVLPHLLARTNDLELTYKVTSLEILIAAANEPWITAIEDSRLRVGNIGTYERSDTYCGASRDGNTYCVNQWTVPLVETPIVVNNTTHADIDFTMAFFENDEMVEAVEELHDADADPMRVYAIVTWEASNGSTGEIRTEDSFTIVPE